MINIDIIPLTGIMIDNSKTVLLGLTELEVREILGMPEDTYENQYYYYNSGIRFDFNEKGELEFIECLGGLDNQFIAPVVYGYNAFTTPAKTIIELLSLKNNAAPLTENQNGYSFVQISTGLYREISPEGVELMVKDASKDNTYELIKEDVKKADYFSTIGIGLPGYYL